MVTKYRDLEDIVADTPEIKSRGSFFEAATHIDVFGDTVVEKLPARVSVFVSFLDGPGRFFDVSDIPNLIEDFTCVLSSVGAQLEEEEGDVFAILKGLAEEMKEKIIYLDSLEVK